MALIGSLSSGVSAMKAFSTGIEVIGNNIANINTYGYKDQRADYADSFSEIMSQASGSAGSSPITNQIGTGSRVSNINTNFGQGGISSTGVITDLAINGTGFFQVSDPLNGTLYATRAGNFTPNQQGQVVTSDGKNLQGLIGGNLAYTVTEVAGELVYTKTVIAPNTVGDMDVNYSQPTVANGGLIVDASVDPDDFTTAQINAGAPQLQLSSYAFDSNGNLSYYLSNGDSFIHAQVLLMNFSDPNALVKAGDNLYSNFAAAGAIGGITLTAANNQPGTNGLGTFQTQALELSNVDLTQEFANLITTQRSFQAASRIITVSDDVLQEVVNLKR